MARETVFDSLIKDLDEEIDNNKEFMASGSCHSFDEYQKVVGLIGGLSQAKLLVSELQKKIENA